MLRRLILLSGPVSVGKTTLARYLADQFSVRQIKTRSLIMAEKDAANERAALQEAGEQLDAETGGKWLADAIVREAEGIEDNDEAVVDSVRIAGQIEAIRSLFGPRVLHVHITGTDATLEARYEQRKRDGAADRELPTYAHVRLNPTERQVEELANIADVVVDTDRCTAEDVLVRVASHLAYYGRGTQRLVDVMVGGQWGSEGKGHIASYLAPEYSILVRVGGPNAGHTVYRHDDQIHAFYHLPSGTLHAPETELVLGPGSVIYVPKLLKEIADAKATDDRLAIDPQAMIIEESDRELESTTLRKEIASTAQGVGAATARKVMRGAFPDGPPVRLARDIPELNPFVRSTLPILETAFRKGRKVFLEGTQGTGLSLHHGDYRWVTSRDTCVSGCLSDAGIAPSRVRRIVMVCRTYPIRVQNPTKEGGRAAQSGPMGREITWETVAERSRIPIEELQKTETTTTTKRRRRVAEFNWALLRHATSLNGPTDVALSFSDYIDKKNKDARRFEQLTTPTIRLIEEIERVASAPVSLISTQFEKRSIIDRRRW